MGLSKNSRQPLGITVTPLTQGRAFLSSVLTPWLIAMICLKAP